MKLPEKSTKTTEDSKQTKWLNSIKSAGGGAEVLGLIVLVFTALSLCMQRIYYDPTSLMFWWLLVVAGSGYLVWSGNYIKNNKGNATQALLFANGIMCLLGVRGLIPIIVSIQSFVGFSAYRKLKKSNRLPIQQKDLGVSKKEIIIFITLAVIGLSLVMWSNSARSGAVNDAAPNISTEVQQSKDNMDALTKQYETCSEELIARKDSVDLYDQDAIDSYNSDYDACEAVRLRQNEAVDNYNKLIGQ